MSRDIISFGTSTNEYAPKKLMGTAPSMNNETDFHLIWLNPKNALERLPINCAIVRTGIAIVVPIVFVNSGNKSNAPPNPAAPDIAAAKKPPANISNRSMNSAILIHDLLCLCHLTMDTRHRSLSSHKCASASIDRFVCQFLLYTKQLVVFLYSFTPAGSTGLELAGTGGYGEI